MGKTALKLLVAAIVVSVAYTILGALAGSYLTARGLQRFLVVQDGQRLGMGDIRFNPFTLSARLRDLRLSEANDRIILTVDSMRLDFTIGSLFRQKIVLREVSLESPELLLDSWLAVARTGFAHLIGPLSPLDREAAATPELRIESGSITDGTLRVRDGTFRLATQPGFVAGEPATTAPREVTLSGIGLHIKQFHSGSDELASLVLSARVNESASLYARGQLVPLSGALETAVQVSGLDLARFSPMVRSNSGAGRVSGILHADGRLSHKADETLFTGEFTIGQFEARSAAHGQAVFSADELSASGAGISLWPLRASVQFMDLKRPQFALALPANGEARDDFTGIPVHSQWLFGAFVPPGPPAVVNGRKPLGWPPTIGALTVEGGRISIVHPRAAKSVVVELNHVAGGITSRTDDHTAAWARTLFLQLAGAVGESSSVTLGGLVRIPGVEAGVRGGVEDSSGQGNTGNIIGAIELSQFDAALLSDYFAQFAARDIVSGTLNLDLRYYLKAGKLAAASTILLKDLLLGPSTGRSPGADLPLELALALLTDPLGEIRFELPFLSHVTNSASPIAAAIEAALAGFVSDVTTRPFDVLADLAGVGGSALNIVVFDPGSAAIIPAAEQQLHALGEALGKRPALGLRAIGGHARQADRIVLARQQIQLHVALAASTRPSGRPEQQMLDFADPKVQVVLDEFAAARLPAGELADLRPRKGLNGENDVSARVPDPAAYYEVIFEALVAREPVGDNALRQLARYRAQSVIRQLESLGVAAGRLRFGLSAEPEDEPVRLEVFALATSTASSADHDLPGGSAEDLSFAQRSAAGDAAHDSDLREVVRIGGVEVPGQ